METKAILLKTLELIENQNEDLSAKAEGQDIQKVHFVDIYLMIEVLSELSKSRHGHLKSFVHRLCTMTILNLHLLLSTMQDDIFYCPDNGKRVFIRYDWLLEQLSLKTKNPIIRFLRKLIGDNLQDTHDIYSVVHGGLQRELNFRQANPLIKLISLSLFFPIKFLFQLSWQIFVLISVISMISLCALLIFLDQTKSDILNDVERDLSYRSTKLIFDGMREIGKEDYSIIDYRGHHRKVYNHINNLEAMKDKVTSCRYHKRCRNIQNRDAVVKFLDNEINSVKSTPNRVLRQTFHNRYSMESIIEDITGRDPKNN